MPEKDLEELAAQNRAPIIGYHEGITELVVNTRTGEYQFVTRPDDVESIPNLPNARESYTILAYEPGQPMPKIVIDRGVVDAIVRPQARSGNRGGLDYVPDYGERAKGRQRKAAKKQAKRARRPKAAPLTLRGVKL